MFNEICSCTSYHKIKPYRLNNAKSRLILKLECFQITNNQSQIAPINECNLECNCDETQCNNRLVQNGCKFDLEIFNCESVEKGKGVLSRELIEAGSFVCEYMGEIIDKSEAETRFNTRSSFNEPNYILNLCEHFFNSSEHETQSTFIDAKNYGNIARFLNHSCEPNLFVLPVRINNLIPHAALFALNDIPPGKELSYNYNGTIDSNFASSTQLIGKTKCYCMSKSCQGYLPANKF